MIDFKQTELHVTGVYKPFSTLSGFPMMEFETLDFPITPKENMKAFCSRKEYAWVPDLTTDVNLVIDYTTPDNSVQNLEGGVDSFGVRWDPLADRSLPAFVTPGNPVLEDITEWEKFPMPNPADWDWKAMQETYKGRIYDDRCNYGWLPGVYLERLIHLMDSEECFCAMMEEPEAVQALFEKLTDIHCKNLEYQKEALAMDMIWISDDWGTQRSPFISRDTLNELIAPSYKRLMNKCRELDIIPITHSCGMIQAYLPDMVDMGIQIWEPQVTVNPDLFDIHKQYQDRIMIEDYSLFTDEGCDDPADFEKQMHELAGKFLMEDSVFITSGIYGSDLSKKRKILYEIERKAALKTL